MASSRKNFWYDADQDKIVNHENAVKLDDLKKDISFNDISFNYDEKESLFKNFNLQIPFGSSIGIVGDTGSGKTTISKLLLRLYDLSDGSIYIGEHNIKEIDIRSLRSKVGSLVRTLFCLTQQLVRI